MDWMRDLFAVMFVLGLLLALGWLSRSRSGTASLSSRLPFRVKSFPFKPGKKTGSLVQLDRLTLTPANSLHLVRAGARTFLLAAHSAGVVLLSELITPAEETAEENGKEAPGERRRSVGRAPQENFK